MVLVSRNLILLYVRFCSMARERCCHEADRQNTQRRRIGSGRMSGWTGRVRGQGGLEDRDHCHAGERSTPERTVLEFESNSMR